MHPKLRRSASAEIAILIGLCILSRLPQLLSPNLLLDGDEAIVGLMAKHIHDGKELPVFFWGQAYGFSLIEASLCAAAFLLGGITDYSMKLAMLALWTTGVVFLYKTFKGQSGTQSVWPFVLTAVFILSPAWAVWSMKARGGYLTAFACSSVVIWLLLHRGLRHSSLRLFCAGLLLILIFESQALWLPGLLPVLAYKLSQKPRWQHIIALCAGVIVLLPPLLYMQRIGPHYWQPRVFVFSPGIFLENVKALPGNLYHSLTGYYYLQQVFAPSAFSAAFARLIIGVIVLLLSRGFYLLIKGRVRVHALFIVFLPSVLLTLCYALFLAGDFMPRYLLPLSGWVFIASFFALRNVRPGKATGLTAGAFILTGVLSLIGFKDYKFQEATKTDLLTLCDYLKRQNVRHLFVTDGLLQWQIMFYSREGIIARFKPSTDRNPEYTRLVNEALSKHEKVALVTYGTIPDATATINHYCILLNPDRAGLEQQSFHF